MNTARWGRLKTLVADAAEMPAGARRAFVQAQCGGDAELFAEAISLVETSDDLGDFIAKPPTGIVAAALLADEAPDVPSRIGVYRVIRTLGRGGMGTVYLAERDDDAYRGQVAIKVMKRGMDTDEVVRRFRAERQLLATLDHPNIVRLLDGGTTDDGLPYFVMELVEGDPIDEFCRKRALTAMQRVDLFIELLPAVQSAHRNLVVHRDLKPSNILVSDDGRVHLLDFGIAKLLSAPSDGATWHTQATDRPMTPDYASPEQVLGEPVTTSSDVYSLGVLLYELLAGVKPFSLRGLTPSEIERQLRESVPLLPSQAVAARGVQTPSALRVWPESPDRVVRQLRGDLDLIVMTAMHPDPARRYASVDALAEDLRRFRQSLPVSARPDGFAYRASKFVQRHRVAVAAAAAVAVLGGVSMWVIVWQAGEARAQREIAVQRFDDARQLASSYLFELHDAIATLPGSTAARALVVRRSQEYLDRLSQRVEGDPDLQAELATAYARVGDVQWHRYYSHLGQATAALASQQKAMAMRAALLAADPRNAARRLDVASSHVLLGDVLIATGELKRAIGHYRSGLALREEVAAERPGDPAVQYAIAVAHQRLGDNLGNPGFPNIGDTAGSITHYTAMQQVFQKQVAADPSDVRARHSLSIGFEKIGDVRRGAGDLAGAREQYVQALQVREELTSRDPVNPRYRRDLAVAHGKVGLMSEQVGDLASARTRYEQALALRERLAAQDASDAGARFDVATAHRQLANLAWSERRRDTAIRHYRAGLDLATALSKSDPANKDFRDLFESLTGLLARAGVY